MPTPNEVSDAVRSLATIFAPNLEDPDWLTLEEAGDGARVTG